MVTSDAHMLLHIWTHIKEIQYGNTIFLQIFQTDHRKNLFQILFSIIYLKIKTHMNIIYGWIDSNSLRENVMV